MCQKRQDNGDDCRLENKLNVFYEEGNTFSRFALAEICTRSLLMSNTE